MVEEMIRTERMALPEAIAALGVIVLSDKSLEDVLGCLAEVTKQAVDGAFDVSITMHERRPATAASTSDFARTIDDFQYDAGAGPCLTALEERRTIVVDDQEVDPRWPEYGARAAAAGLRSSLSVPLLVEDRHVAALNIYGVERDAFGPHSVQAAEDLSVYAAVTLNNADLYFSATSLADQMTTAMQTRSVIEQAKGVIMGGRRCNAEEAFAVLVKESQTSHRKLRDVAQSIIDEIDTPRR